MKKPYQIEAQRAVKELAEMAADGNLSVQRVLPMAEMIGWLRKGVSELIRQAGLQLMDLLMQEEVRGLAGERSQRQAERRASRWGSERGYCRNCGRYLISDCCWGVSFGRRPPMRPFRPAESRPAFEQRAESAAKLGSLYTAA